METPPSDDGFELVEKGSYGEDLAVYTDDEYEFVEAPVKWHAAPPVAGGGNQLAFPPPSPETITGCDDQDHPTKKMIAPSTPPQDDVARSSSSPPPKEEEKMASPFRFDDVAPPCDLVDLSGVVAKINNTPTPRAPAAYGGAYAEDEDEVTEDEEDDDDDDYGYLYASCYDHADFGRARRVKPSSGRRGRTKKATTKGRPRGEKRSSHIAGNY